MVKTNTKGFYNETIENITKYCPVDSYLVLRSKPMVTRVRPLIAIGYKYDVQKFFSFIDTDNAGIKNAGLTYLYT